MSGFTGDSEESFIMKIRIKYYYLVQIVLLKIRSWHIEIIVLFSTN